MAKNNPSSDKARATAVNACREIMRPLSRFLIRSGIGFKEFAGIAKEALVETVSKDYGIRGRETNISRTAVLTGLTRKEVARIRSARGSSECPDMSAVSRPAQVLDAWYNADGFQSSDGRPLDLAFEGFGPDFCTLARQSGGDIPPRAMLKELMRAGCVVQLPDSRYRVVSLTFIPDPADPESISAASQAISDLISTLNNNLFVSDQAGGSLLERRVFSETDSPQEVRRFRRLATLEAEKLIQLLNDWLTTQEKIRGSSRSTDKNCRFGLGIYLFEDER